MFGRRYVLVGVALFSVTCLSAPAYAGSSFWNGVGQGVGGSLTDWGGSLIESGLENAGAPDYARVRDYSSASWYQDWLVSRRSGSTEALYNHPCSVSDGTHETAVDCRMAAIASGWSVPGAGRCIIATISPYGISPDGPGLCFLAGLPGGYPHLADAPSADGYRYPSAHIYYRYTSRVQPHFRVVYHTTGRRR
jgi:hypothetical protein